MSMPKLAKLAGADLAQMRPHIDAPAPAEILLDGCQSVPQALDALVDGGFFSEAARLVSHAMPRREGVWWACMCARATAPSDLASPDAAALEAAELWVRRPTDENRRAAFARAEEARFGTPEAWACVGAFWSGDSMAPIEAPKVPPAPHLAGMAIAGAVALAAVRTRADRQMARLAKFVASSREIADGGTGRIPPEES